MAAIALAVLSFTVPLIIYRYSGNVQIARVVFFPFGVYQYVRSVVRAPGYQDVMYGECIVPHCDLASILLTIVFSGVVYYSIAVLLLRGLSR